MKFLTKEQEKIVSLCRDNTNHINNILISANAGCGKTFTAKEVLNAFFSDKNFLPNENPKALYLIFNKTMSDFFKRSASHYELENCSFANKLDEVVETRTYHSFLKKGENFDNALEMIFLPTSKELKINYAKGELNKYDIELIAKNFTNFCYEENLIIDLDNDDKTLAYMRSFANQIQEPLQKLFNLYFSNATAIEDSQSCNELIQSNNYDVKALIPYGNTNRFNQFLQNQSYADDINTFLLRKFNYILDNLVANKQIEVCHNYYYKRIYENALAYPTILKDLFSPYKMIIIDECQDTDAMMFNLVKTYMELAKQDINLANTKLICFGDNKQNIYKFSGSFNIFEWEKQNPNFFHNLTLSQSFRYGQKIADFGKLISSSTNTNFNMVGSKYVEDAINPKALNLEEIADLLIERYKDSGKFVTRNDRDKFAIICRTNNKCIEIFKELQELIKNKTNNSADNLKRFNEEYIFLDSEIKGSLKDLAKKKLISLFNYGFTQDSLQTFIATHRINYRAGEITVAQAIAEEKMHPFLKANGFEYLLKYDPSFLEKLIGTRTKNNAFILITNCHQSKGKEYNTVLLADDFFKRKNDYYFTEEEVNISHTAITRAKSELLFLDGDDNFLHYFYSKNIVPELNTKIDRAFFQDIKHNRQKEAYLLEQERIKKEKELELERENDIGRKLLGL